VIQKKEEHTGNRRRKETGGGSKAKCVRKIHERMVLTSNVYSKQIADII